MTTQLLSRFIYYLVIRFYFLTSLINIDFSMILLLKTSILSIVLPTTNVQSLRFIRNKNAATSEESYCFKLRFTGYHTEIHPTINTVMNINNTSL